MSVHRLRLELAAEQGTAANSSAFARAGNCDRASLISPQLNTQRRSLSLKVHLSPQTGPPAPSVILPDTKGSHHRISDPPSPLVSGPGSPAHCSPHPPKPEVGLGFPPHRSLCSQLAPLELRAHSVVNITVSKIPLAKKAFPVPPE